jgi:hypothetical protein
MSGEHHLRDQLHDATHRVPGVPAHVEHPAGHHGHAPANRPHNHSHNHNHSPARRPRVLVGWQRRIALFFGQQL